jgi:hypothetical protein
LIRHALGGVHDEALIAGLASGIGFMYFVFEYRDLPPLLTIVAQHHPDPWVQTALDRLHVPYDLHRGGRPQWTRVRKAVDAGHPVFCVVDRSRLPWHGMESGLATDPYTVVIAGYDGDTLYVDDEAATPHPIGTGEFGAAWSAYEKGRHQMIVPTEAATAEPDIDGAIATTVAHLTGPVLGNNFDVNFGFSGMEKLSAQLRDARTKSGWERRFGAPISFFHGVRRLYECLEVEYTAPGATRPLYAGFLDLAGRPEAADLFRESARGWARLASLALETVSGLGAYTDICEERMRLIMTRGYAARDEIRALGEKANALAEDYGAPDAGQRRQLFDELADIVDANIALERRAVELL